MFANPPCRGGLVELFALVVLRTLWKWNRDFSSIENKKVFWFYLRFRVHQSRFNFIKKPRATPNDADTFSRFDAFGGEITATLKIAVVFVINISESYGWQAYPITQPHKFSWIHVTSLTKIWLNQGLFWFWKLLVSLGALSPVSTLPMACFGSRSVNQVCLWWFEKHKN